jgi:hypothetical protein
MSCCDSPGSFRVVVGFGAHAALVILFYFILRLIEGTHERTLGSVARPGVSFKTSRHVGLNPKKLPPYRPQQGKIVVGGKNISLFLFVTISFSWYFVQSVPRTVFTVSDS